MSEDLGKLLLRLCLGGLLLFHGVHKLLNGLGPIKTVLAAHNISDAVAYAVYLGELVAPLLIVIGLFSRIGAALIAVSILVGVLMFDLANLTAFAPDGGYALETQLFYFVTAIAVALLGAGRFSVGGGRYN